MKSQLLRNDYQTSWKYKIEQPISSRTKLRVMGACLLADAETEEAGFVLDQSLISYAVIFFSLGYFLNL